MNKKILLIIFFVLIAVYVFTQLEPAQIKEKFSTIHPITAISMVIIIAYLIIRIKYKKKQTEDNDKTGTKEIDSAKDESSESSESSDEE